jgi:cytochrome c-type biogenesis protein
METGFVLFLAGAASFVSPCVLPLIPAYIFYIAGKNPKDMERPDAKLIVNGLMFILGFSAVFMMLGATASAIGVFLSANKQTIRLLSGIVIIAFGVFQTGLVQIGFLNREKRFYYRGRASAVSSFVMGMAFGFGWTPCIGYTLAPALMLAANQRTVWQGVGLLGIYSLGFALPFLLLSVLLKFALKWLERIKKYMGIIKIVSGAVLIAMGILILLGWL